MVASKNNIIVKEINVKELVTKSNLPVSDYVINPYVGCSHACKYCYASFMKRFTNHPEKWGCFVDVKRCNKPINITKLFRQRVFMSSVTDCYNQLEEKYKLTRQVLEQIKDVDFELTISTKSKLILRDLDLLKQFKNLKVCMSINTINEKFRADMDTASTIAERFETLKTLHQNGIYTVLFMSPIFPYITEWKEIIEASKSFIDEFWFENLNLRGDYKFAILNYIEKNYPEYYGAYKVIYNYNNNTYWEKLAIEMDDFCKPLGINYTNFFYHKHLVEEKKKGDKQND